MNAGKIPLTKMYRKVSAKTGSEYFTGRLGRSRILLFRSREQGNEGDDEIFDLLIESVEDDGGAGRPPRQERQPRTRRQPQEKAAAEIVDDPIPDFAR